MGGKKAAEASTAPETATQEDVPEAVEVSGDHQASGNLPQAITAQSNASENGSHASPENDDSCSNIMTFLGTVCATFGFLDYLLFEMDVTDLTGLQYGPYILCGVGSLLIYLGQAGKKRRPVQVMPMPVSVAPAAPAADPEETQDLPVAEEVGGPT